MFSDEQNVELTLREACASQAFTFHFQIRGGTLENWAFKMSVLSPVLGAKESK